MKRFGRLLLILLSLVSAPSMARVAYCQVNAPAAQPPVTQAESVVAIVNGKRVITERDVDKLIGPELEELRQRMNALRKRAIDRLVEGVLLEDAAKARGITADQLEKSMVPDKVEVDEAEVERAFKSRPPVNPAQAEEVKKQIRLGLENRARAERFKAAMAQLRNEARVQVFVEETASAVVRVSSTGPSKGVSSAPITVVEFADFQCPYCREETSTLDRLLKAYHGRVRLVFKQMPLPSHPRSFRAAEASVCAAEQGKFWEYHDKLFGSDDLSEGALVRYGAEVGVDSAGFDKCLNQDAGRDAVLNDALEGQAAGIRVTPSFVVNGRLLTGLTNWETLKKVIEDELVKAKPVAQNN